MFRLRMLRNLQLIIWLSVNLSVLKAVSWWQMRESTERFLVIMKPLKNTWIMCIPCQAWKTFGSRLTKKMSKLSRKCLFATRKKSCTWAWKTMILTMTSTRWRRQELTYHLRNLRKHSWTKTLLS